MGINYQRQNQNNQTLRPVGNTATVPTPENIGINGTAAADGDLTTPSQNGQGTPVPTTPAPEQTPTTPEVTPTPEQNGQSGTPVPTTPAPEQAPSATSPDVSGGNSQTSGNTGESTQEPLLKYEDFLLQKPEDLENIKNQTVDFYENQKNETLTALDEQKTAADTHAQDTYDRTGAAITEQRGAADAQATEQRDMLIGMSEEQRQAVYDFAEAQGIADKNYAAAAYQKLVDAINATRTSGQTMATEQRDLLLNMSKEQRDAVYAAAERQRAEAYTNADVARQRAITDSYSAYLQSQAGYGANAEALGRMGITGGGYGDWVNNNAYATQRAEAQAARAQSDAAKRSAKYTEDMTKLEADNTYNEKKYAAESEYSNRMYDIDTSYRTNMLGAEQDKLKADYEADSNERARKQEADSTHAQNKYTAESSYSDMLYQNASAEREQKLENDLAYSDMLYQNEAAHKAGTLEANQTAEAGKFGAEMSYAENLMNNKGELAEYRENEKKEAEAKADALTENARGVYTELLGYANSGTYSAEQLERLCDEYGLTPEQRQSLLDAVAGYDTKKAEAEAKTQGENFISMMSQTEDPVGYVDAAVAAGSISAEQGNTYLYSKYRNDVYYGDVDTKAVDELVEAGRISPEQKEELMAVYNNGVDTSANNFKNTDGSLISEDEAVDLIAKAKKDTWISSDTINALIDIYEKLYPDGDIIPRPDTDVLPPEAIEDTTGKHIGTSTLTESTEDAIGKLFK